MTEIKIQGHRTTVQDLIGRLSSLPGDACVVFECSVWDHGRVIEVLRVAHCDIRKCAEGYAITGTPMDGACLVSMPAGVQ